jgi:hypothetical protein
MHSCGLASAVVDHGAPAPPEPERSARMAPSPLTSRRTVDHARVASALCRRS